MGIHNKRLTNHARQRWCERRGKRAPFGIGRVLSEAVQVKKKSMSQFGYRVASRLSILHHAFILFCGRGEIWNDHHGVG